MSENIHGPSFGDETATETHSLDIYDAYIRGNAVHLFSVRGPLDAAI